MTDAEQAFIGCCLLDPKVALASTLEPKHFQDTRAARILLVIRHHPDDMTAFTDADKPYLADAMEMVASAGMAPLYEERIRVAWQRRAMSDLGATVKVQADMMEPIEDIETLISSKLMEIEEASTKEQTHEETIERLAEDITNPMPSDFLTAIPKFDEAAGGFNRGECIVVYGDTSHGKSSTIYSLVLASLLSAQRVSVLDYEMGRDLVYRRLAALVSEVSLQEVVTRRLSTSSLADYQKALETLKGCNLQVLNDPISVGLQKSKAFSSDIIIVDYVQLAADAEKSKNENLSQTITSIMRKVKNFSIQEKCAVFIGSQVVKDYGAGRPRLSDIKESGAIANSADKVIAAYWPAKKGNVNDESIYLLGLDKNKNGPTKDLVMQIKPWCAKICEPSGSFSPADIQEAVK